MFGEALLCTLFGFLGSTVVLNFAVDRLCQTVTATKALRTFSRILYKVKICSQITHLNFLDITYFEEDRIH